MAGIREIAKQAGVSISTVSYALNGSAKVSEPTRIRIKEYADRLGYTPKLAARTLKGNKTNIIGVYISGFQGEFYGELLDGMQHRLELLGYDMMVSSGNRTQKFLSEKLFDGAIILDNKFQDNDLKKVLTQGNKVVVLDREVSHENARTVLLDNASGSKEAVEYLLSQNQENYYIISGPRGNYDVETRLQAAIETFEKSGKTFKILDGDFTEQSGYEAAKKIIAEVKDKTVGVYSLNDDEAIGFYRYARRHHILLEPQFKIVSFDNNHSADFLYPILPSISYRKHLWGEQAAETLIDLIESKPSAKNQTIKTALSFRK